MSRWEGGNHVLTGHQNTINNTSIGSLELGTQVCPFFSPIYGQEKNTILLIAAMYRNELSTERE